MGPPMPGHDQPGPPPPPGAGGADFYGRYHPLPTPVQPQQAYNPYISVAPVGVGMGGIGRMQAGQAMSPGGAFGMLRR